MPFVEVTTTNASVGDENNLWRITPKDGPQGTSLAINQDTGVLTLEGPLEMGNFLVRTLYGEAREILEQYRCRIPGPDPKLVEIGESIDTYVKEAAGFSVPESARDQLHSGTPVLLVAESRHGSDIYAGVVGQDASLEPPVYMVAFRFFTPTEQHPAEITKSDQTIPLSGTLPGSSGPATVYVTGPGIIDQIKERVVPPDNSISELRRQAWLPAT